MQQIDFVLIHPLHDDEHHSGKRGGGKRGGGKPGDERVVSAKEAAKEAAKRLERQAERRNFEQLLRDERTRLEREVIGDNVFTKLQMSFRRLCSEAESLQLEMPLKNCPILEQSNVWFWKKCERRLLRTDRETDYVSAAYLSDRHRLYLNSDDPAKFFRPALRSFLCYQVMINLDTRKLSDAEFYKDPLRRKGLQYLFMKDVYTDGFILHDETKTDRREMPPDTTPLADSDSESLLEEDFIDTELLLSRAPSLSAPAPAAPLSEARAAKIAAPADADAATAPEARSKLESDPRAMLHRKWGRACRYQPLWMVRNYFGEKIAFYFAWTGTLLASLALPAILGLGVFAYGLIDSIAHQQEIEKFVLKQTKNSSQLMEYRILLALVNRAFDNQLTPYYSFFICGWATVFLTLWKRRNARLAYMWDVDRFEDTEPDRPNFYGTKVRIDPVTMAETEFYPMRQRVMKFVISYSVLIMMVAIVCISTISVIVYRVVILVNYCHLFDPKFCMIVTSGVSSVLNAVSILLLGKVYELFARKLTDWENHRRESQYNDALVLKLFAFQFANSYTSLFYIAFFRGVKYKDGILGLGAGYSDDCGASQNCMQLLSIQVLVLTVVKPAGKFAKDVVLPWFLRSCMGPHRRFFRKSPVAPPRSFLERERRKPRLCDFTLGEFTEKVIVYGYLTLFSASLPLSPLLILLLNVADVRIDAQRLLWLYRRPVGMIAHDIGRWSDILQFINIVGAISNAFLIGFTSNFGRSYQTLVERFYVVLIFEHAVVAVKLFLKMVIPEVPSDIKLAIRREKFQVRRIMEKAAIEKHRKLRKLRETVRHSTRMSPPSGR